MQSIFEHATALLFESFHAYVFVSSPMHRIGMFLDYNFLLVYVLGRHRPLAIFFGWLHIQLALTCFIEIGLEFRLT